MSETTSALHEYISGLLRHGWDESWLPDLSLEQIAAIAAIAQQELHDKAAELRGRGE